MNLKNKQFNMPKSPIKQLQFGFITLEQYNALDDKNKPNMSPWGPETNTKNPNLNSLFG